MTKIPKIAVLASGNGSNLQAIVDHIQRGTLRAEIVLVLSDQPTAFAIERAKNAKIPNAIVERKSFASKKEFENVLVDTLKNHQTEWVILAGFMRLLSADFISQFSNRILNIHPSLLPAYPGLHAIERAWKDQAPEIGVTVHFVDDGMDTGPVISQERIPFIPGEPLEQLTQRVHQLEHDLYPKAIQKVIWMKDQAKPTEGR